MAEYSAELNVSANNTLEEYMVIIDIGEGFTKVGFAGEEAPRAIFPTITGKEKYKNVMVGSGGGSYVGEDCSKMRGVLKISYPISRGNVVDWDAFFAVLTHIFYNVLRIDPSKAHILYAESALTPLQNKQYIARVLFETYKAKSVYIASAPILSLFSTGLTTGVVVESGEGLTWVVPIVNGKIAYQAVQRLPLAGIDVNEHLKSLLLTRGISLSGTSAEREILREIKEKNCFVALDPAKVTRTRQTEMNDYVLPDGEKVQISMDIRVNGPEILFHPELLGYNIYSIQQAIIAAIAKVDRSYWRTLLQNIILSGGNMGFQGLELRLEEEINSLLYQLGPLPQDIQNAEILPKVEKPKMVNVPIAPKQKDTCPKCGAMVNLSESQYCPDCGNDLSAAEIKIGNLQTTKYPDKCPNCKKKLDEKSEFCPYCGRILEKVVISLPAGMKAMEVPPVINDFDAFETNEFSGYDSSGDTPDSNKDVRIIMPEVPQAAIFIGASILGSLQSFKSLFITYDQYLKDPNCVNVDFSSIL